MNHGDAAEPRKVDFAGSIVMEAIQETGATLEKPARVRLTVPNLVPALCLVMPKQ